MTNEHGDFIWYELMTTDADAAQDFYGGLVGWHFNDAGQPGMDYRLFAKKESVVGGLMSLTAEMQANGARPLWAGYVGVDDVDASAEAIAKAGGAILMPPRDIPDVGRFAFVQDPQGAPFYIMRGTSDQASESFATHTPREGHCAWNELATSDPTAAKTFYGEIFGWVKSDSMDMGPMGTYEMMKNGADRDFMFGGLMKKPDDMPVSLWSYYFRVLSIDEAAAYVTAHGGQVVMGPMEIPGGEFSLNGVDPQGAFFGLVGKK
ncbi:MAG: VOC family protein [Pseudomonadota bacterium]